MKRLADLSPRHRRLAEAIAAGRANKEIANDFNLTVGTVKIYIHALVHDVLGFGTREEVAAWVGREQALQPLRDWCRGAADLPNELKRAGEFVALLLRE